MENDQKVKWGIVGLGGIAAKFASDLRLSPNAILHAVASRSESKASEFAQEYGAQYGFGSYEELIHHPEVDVVYIATPHSMHHDLTLKCIDAGKAVLCEKPMALDAIQVKEMVDLARSKKVFLMEGIWTRLIPATKTFLKLMQDKIIGEIRHIRADFGFANTHSKESRILNKKLGGGSLLDVGIYPVYFSLLLFGEPQSIKASAVMTDTGVDKDCTMKFTYENGATAELFSSIGQQTPTEAEIIGTNGSLKLHSRFHHPKKISLFIDGEVEKIIEEEYFGEGYIHEIEEVNECLFQGKIESDLLPLEMSLRLSKILDRVKKEINLDYNDA